MLPNEHKNFITDWFWHKQEYDDTCLNDSQFDSDEDLQECPSPKLKAEHLSSESGCSTSVSTSDDSCSSTDTGIAKDDEKNNNCPPSSFNLNSQLSDQMNDFKLATDSIVSEWYHKITSDLPEVKRYLNYLANEGSYFVIHGTIQPSKSISEAHPIFYVHFRI